MNEILLKIKEVNQNKCYEEWQKLIFNKNVCIVGQSSYLLNQEQGSKIDAYDIVVRINEAFIDIQEYKKDYGERYDILYITNDHRMYDSGFLINNYDKIINKMVSLFGVPEYHYTYKSFQKFYQLLSNKNSIINNDAKRKLVKDYLNNKFPTTGFFAILDILSFGPESLYIPGFCFYLDYTRILKRFEGYNKPVNSIHNSITEINIFKNLRKEHKIIVDDYTEIKLSEFKNNSLKN